MNSEQKKFTIKQIHKYQDQAEDLEQKVKINKLFIYGGIALTVLTFRVIPFESFRSDIFNSCVHIVGTAGMMVAVANLKNMITNISKKSGLENMATDLQYQLDNAELEEKEECKGRGL